jgi:hypothetical protein
MRAYTYNEIAAIIAEAHRRGFETARELAADAPMPAPPAVHEVVDHPYDGSDAPGQAARLWLEPDKRQRGQVR